jgi:negative regulator of flagellin synthesis FlgM
MAIGNIKNQGAQASTLPNTSGNAAKTGSNAAAGADALMSETTAKPQSPSAASAAKAAKALAGYEKVAKSSPSVKEAANVQISQKAKDLSLIKKTLDETPDIREDKIAHFKELIASGKYKPDAGKIADGILKEAVMDELSKTPDIAMED